ncbi:hypothetical protein E4U41_000426 [Claviceps citrina]|nr:hypothetical protein E4U41_000426 [Claviceps citrina]
MTELMAPSAIFHIFAAEKAAKTPRTGTDLGWHHEARSWIHIPEGEEREEALSETV